MDTVIQQDLCYLFPHCWPALLPVPWALYCHVRKPEWRCTIWLEIIVSDCPVCDNVNSVLS